MRCNYIQVFLFLLFLTSCSHFQYLRHKEYTILEDSIGTRWIDVHLEKCTARALSFNSGHLRFAIESLQTQHSYCEVGAPHIIKALAPATKKLLRSHSQKIPKTVTLEISMASSSSLVVKWALFLKQSSEWQQRPKQKDAWDTSELNLIKKLLLESRLFDIYTPVFEVFPQYSQHSLDIQKVDYKTASQMDIYEAVLKPAGFFPQERVPLPLFVELVISK